MTISDLSSKGFNVEEAMEFCVDDEEIYLEVLETALEEGKEKVPLFKELLVNKDFDRYIIEAHGLKNAAKQIGCDNLSEIAKTSELSGKAGDIDAMVANHDALLEEYERVLEVIEQLF